MHWQGWEHHGLGRQARVETVSNGSSQFDREQRGHWAVSGQIMMRVMPLLLLLRRLVVLVVVLIMTMMSMMHLVGLADRQQNRNYFAVLRHE